MRRLEDVECDLRTLEKKGGRGREMEAYSWGIQGLQEALVPRKIMRIMMKQG
jgi:hypothetical protein